MANLSITAVCNRSCRYCFARDALAGLSARHLDTTTFDAALDLIERAGIDQVRILGGEPTCHPDFAALVDRVLARGLRLMVFSNGLMSEHAAQTLERAPIDRVSILINVLDFPRPVQQGGGTALDHARQHTLFRRLGRRIHLGVNIDRPNTPLDPLLDLITEYSLAPAVRLGLAHPAVGGSNAFLHPRAYAAVGTRIAAFATAARDASVRVELDCGFVPCMFPPEALAALGTSASDLGRRCNAIPDILPDGSAVACYPLASLWHAADATQRELADVKREAEETLAAYRTIGVFRECASCSMRRAGTCRGGCIAAAMRRLRSESWSGTHRTVEVTGQRCAPQAHTKPRWVIPYVDQPVGFWEHIAEEFGDAVREVYFPLPGGIAGSGRPPQPDEHLQDFLRWGGLGRAVLINPVVLPAPLAELAPRLLDALRRLAGEHGVTSVTVADLALARLIRKHLPEYQITASTLMEVADARSAAELNGICDHLVPASGIMRDLPTLKTIRRAFAGRIRLLVNESCLSRCAFRTEHFRQMASAHRNPASLCEALLAREPWQRITGSFVLPQHLHFYDGFFDDLKLAGRVTLRNEGDYFRVLRAYVHRRPLPPHAIGGGPASVLDATPIAESFYRRTLHCGHRCAGCTLCHDYDQEAHRDAAPAPS